MRICRALVLILASTAHGFAAVPAKPNVVFILADDLGYECLGAYGGTSYQTPNLDKLAASGIRFDRCYAQPVCTPTRAQLMTGQYNIRNYYSFGEIDRAATTFAHLFKAAGYTTCMAGKWQLGRDAGLPAKFGFDEYALWQHTRRPPRYANPGLEINGVEHDYTHGEYGPDICQDYALDFLRRKKDGPFFLYCSLMLTHWPFLPTPDSPDWDPKAIGEDVGRDGKHFAEMVAYMDKQVGQLLAQLDALHLRENTLIIFMGDNGTDLRASSQMGARTVVGGKSTTTDAGMHVPFLVSWAGKVRPGSTCADLIDTTDFIPTLIDAVALKAPAGMLLDGRSFYPQLRGEKGHPREWYYSWYARNGDLPSAREFAATTRYKLYRTGEFYDTTKDVLEKHPLTVVTLTGDAAAAAKTLQGALAPFTNARPEKFRKIKTITGPNPDDR
ncbi:MAG: arylsulfatase [Opitutus sp.]|nr:arylsulfatase [Opitutus sp.]